MPPKFHTVIEFNGQKKLGGSHKQKKSSLGSPAWKMLFLGAREKKKSSVNSLTNSDQESSDLSDSHLMDLSQVSSRFKCYENQK